MMCIAVLQGSALLLTALSYMQAIDLALSRLSTPSAGIAPVQQHLSDGRKGAQRHLNHELQTLREEVFRIWEESSIHE